MTRLLCAFTCALFCATGGFADILQSDSTACDHSDSIDGTCNSISVPSVFWPGLHPSPASPWPEAQDSSSVFSIDSDVPVYDLNDGPVGMLRTRIVSNTLFGANYTPAVDDPPGFDLIYYLTVGGTTYRIDQPLDVVFAVASDKFSVWNSSDKFSVWNSSYHVPSSDSSPVVLSPRLYRPWAKDLAEQTTWSEMLSVSLSGAVMAGLVAIRNRRTLR